MYVHYFLSYEHSSASVVSLPHFLCYEHYSLWHQYQVQLYWHANYFVSCIHNSLCHALNSLSYRHYFFFYSRYSLYYILSFLCHAFDICLWCTIKPLPSMILKLSSNPYSSLWHSCNLVSNAYNTFCDPHIFFCHPYSHTKELPVFLMMSSVVVIGLFNNVNICWHIIFVSIVKFVQVAELVSVLPGRSGRVSVGSISHSRELFLELSSNSKT